MNALDVEERRHDLIRLQGEFRLRLHALEKELLRALNASQGNILDDDTVIATLETLKTEAAEISRKVDETDGVMREVEDVTVTYTPLARACSAVYFALEHLSSIHQFYQFSLDFFKAIFDEVVEHNPNLKGVSDPNVRISILKRDLLRLSFRRASVSLLYQDHLVLLMQLVIIKLHSDEDNKAPTGDLTVRDIEPDLDFVLRSSDLGLNSSSSQSSANPMSPSAATGLSSNFSGLTASPQLPSDIDKLVDDTCRSKLSYHMHQLYWCRSLTRRCEDDLPSWTRFIISPEPELAVPTSAIATINEAGEAETPSPVVQHFVNGSLSDFSVPIEYFMPQPAWLPFLSATQPPLMPPSRATLCHLSLTWLTLPKLKFVQALQLHCALSLDTMPRTVLRVWQPTPKPRSIPLLWVPLKASH